MRDQRRRKASYCYGSEFLYRFVVYAGRMISLVSIVISFPIVLLLIFRRGYTVCDLCPPLRYRCLRLYISPISISLYYAQHSQTNCYTIHQPFPGSVTWLFSLRRLLKSVESVRRPPSVIFLSLSLFMTHNMTQLNTLSLIKHLVVCYRSSRRARRCLNASRPYVRVGL